MADNNIHHQSVPPVELSEQGTMVEGQVLQRSPITVDPDVMSGAPVFAGTRVPVQTLFDYLEEGCSLGEFLENFPTVSRDSAVAVLERAAQKVVNGRAVT